MKYQNDDISFTEIIKENMNKLVEIYNNQEISFSELNSKLKLKKLNNTFVFQPKGIIHDNCSNSIFENDSSDRIMNTIIDNTYTEELVDNDNRQTKFDITFNVAEREDGYMISIKYNDSLYEKNMIKRILASYIEVIKNILSNNLKILNKNNIIKNNYDEGTSSNNKNNNFINHNLNSNILKRKENPVFFIKFKKYRRTDFNNNIIITLIQNMVPNNYIQATNCKDHLL